MLKALYRTDPLFPILLKNEYWVDTIEYTVNINRKYDGEGYKNEGHLKNRGQSIL